MSKDSSHGSEAAKESDKFADLRDIAIALAVFLFFAGYVFRTTYFQEFGLEFPGSFAETVGFIVYSYTVFADNIWQTILGAGALLLILEIALRFGRAFLSDDHSSKAAFAVVAVLALPWLHYMGDQAAKHEADKMKAAECWLNETAVVTLTKDAQDQLKAAGQNDLLDSFSNDDLHYITSSGDDYYLARGPNDGPLTAYYTYKISRSEVAVLSLVIPIRPGSDSQAANSKGTNTCT